MKTEEQVNLARMQMLGLMKFTDPADLDPAKRAAFTGIYAALSWVLGLANPQAGQMNVLLAGCAGDAPVAPQAMDLKVIQAVHRQQRGEVRFDGDWWNQ